MGLTGVYETKDFESRFWSQVKKTKSCWLWTGSLDQKGYGRGSGMAGGRVHRISWLLAGKQISSGLVISHLCEVPNCVRPSHLDQVTNRENRLYGHGLTARLARRDKCSRGHLYSVYGHFIYKSNKSRPERRCRECTRILHRERYQKLAGKIPVARRCQGISVANNRPCKFKGVYKATKTGSVWCHWHVPEKVKIQKIRHWWFGERTRLGKAKELTPSEVQTTIEVP